MTNFLSALARCRIVLGLDPKFQWMMFSLSKNSSTVASITASWEAVGFWILILTREIARLGNTSDEICKACILQVRDILIRLKLADWRTGQFCSSLGSTTCSLKEAHFVWLIRIL
ncbi:hypothetical protein OIU76_016176 [Salix suchowensis]|nr:hypothetical protein OIU76_016176 [Salix suchowensis]